MERVGRGVAEPVVQAGMHDGEGRDGEPADVRGGHGGCRRPGQAGDEGDVEGDEGRPCGVLGERAEDIQQAPLAARHGIELVREQEAEQEEVECARHFRVSMTIGIGCPRRQVLKALTMTMYGVPRSWLAVPAVAGQLEQSGRPHFATEGRSLPGPLVLRRC